MKLLKNKKILLLLMMIILFMCINSGKVFGANGLELNFGGETGVAHAWQLQPGGLGTWFCTDSSKSLRYVDSIGLKSPGLKYEYRGQKVTVTPQLAYALYYIKSRGESINNYLSQIQSLVWAAVGDPRGSNDISGIIGARSNQYFDVYDNIFSKVKGDLFEIDKDEKDLKILVDQIGKTYTVGPYKLKLSVKNVDPNIKAILYNEIVGKGNQGSDRNRFAQWNGKILGINGSNVEIVNENGKKIDFPDFVNEKPFYIRFNPDNNGAIKEIGTPKIIVKYIKKILLSGDFGNGFTGMTLPILYCTSIVIGNANTYYIRGNNIDNIKIIPKYKASGYTSIYRESERGGYRRYERVFICDVIGEVKIRKKYSSAYF